MLKKLAIFVLVPSLLGVIITACAGPTPFIPTPTPDTTPPVISSVASSSITSSSAVIAWTTNEAADSQVEYGTTTSYGTSTTLNTALITSHTVNLTGLAASTTYHYRVKSKDAVGNLATGTDNVFITQTPTPVVAYKTYGLNFGPYTKTKLVGKIAHESGPYTKDGQNPDLGTQVSEAQIRELIGIIAPYTQWIRTFGCTNDLEVVGKIAHEYGLKIAVGAWLSKDLSANEAEIASLINIGKAGEADLLIVGSEVLLRNDLTEAQLIDYINRVKSAVPGIPVATADTYGELLSHPAVMAAGNVVLPNYYPYWEGVNVTKAVVFIHQKHKEIIAAAGGKQIIVSESGWPSAGDAKGEAVPSPENASFFFLNFVSWAQATDTSYFYFEAFDEPWKIANEGAVGAHWGVWDKNGVMKPGMKDVFDGETMPDNWSDSDIPGGPGTPEINFTYVPPYGSSDYLEGQVWHIKTSEYRVAVYIKVRGGWWTKPYWSSPLTNIHYDGGWVCDIVTGGVDEEATEIAAFLVPAGYNPPSMSGGDTLPSELDTAVAKALVTRTP